MRKCLQGAFVHLKEFTGSRCGLIQSIEAPWGHGCAIGCKNEDRGRGHWARSALFVGHPPKSSQPLITVFNSNYIPSEPAAQFACICQWVCRGVFLRTLVNTNRASFIPEGDGLPYLAHLCLVSCLLPLRRQAAHTISSTKPWQAFTALYYHPRHLYLPYYRPVGVKQSWPQEK